MPESGGHACLVRSDAALERLVHFLHADPAMLFLVDRLLVAQLTSTWQLGRLAGKAWSMAKRWRFHAIPCSIGQFFHHS